MDPSNPGWVKANFDANVATRTNRGLGVVIRNEHGKMLVAGVRRVFSHWSVDVCEAVAAHFGIELATRFGLNHIHLEGDSMTVVSAIENRAEGFSPIHLIYDSIFALSSSLLNFGCSYVKRYGNTLAHLVAR